MTGRQQPTAANRPVRQRNAVLHYSDDNPNTFTIKRRNGVIIDAPADVIASLSTTSGGAAPASATTTTTITKGFAAAGSRRGSGVSSSGAAGVNRLSPGSSSHQDSEPSTRRRGRPLSAHSVASATSTSSSGRKGAPAASADTKHPATSSAPLSSGDSKRNDTSAPAGGAPKLTAGQPATTRAAPRRGSANSAENGGRPSAIKSNSSVASSSSATTVKTSLSTHTKGSASSRPTRPYPASASTPAPSSSPNRKRKFRPISPKDRWAAGVVDDDEGCDVGINGDDRHNDERGTILNHRVFYQPLLEPNQQNGAWEENLPSSPFFLGGGQQTLSLLSVSSYALRIPTRLRNHQELAKDPPITCWASRPASHSSSAIATPIWAACGDAAGRVHLVSLQPGSRTSVWCCVETLASRREETRNFPAKKTSVTFPNSVVAVAWSRDEHLLAVLTEQELQCIDLLHGQASGNVPRPQSRDHDFAGLVRSSDDFRPIPVTDLPPITTPSTSSLNRLILEWKGDRLLWMPGNGPHPQLAVDERKAPPASVYMVERGRSQPRPVPLHCLTAAWDEPGPAVSGAASENVGLEGEDRILAVIRQDKDSLALIRYDFRSNSILHAVTLSLPGSVRTVHIQRHDLQYSDADTTNMANRSLITLCTSRGIHLHSGESLECLSIVGESVSLHGKSVSWDSCQFVPEPSVSGHRLSSNATAATKGGPKQQRSWYLLQDREEEVKGQGGLSQYQLVAVPQPLREPKELMSTFHIWSSPAASDFAFHLQHPMTLALPSAPGGVLGWTVACDRFGGWRVLGVSAEFGSPFEWSANLQSDFAGREYPVGYTLLTDNVEYLEDEDEIDSGVVFYEEEVSPSSSRARIPLFATPPRPTPANKRSRELEEALKISAEDAPVEVLLTSDERDYDDILADMCPPRSLKRADDDSSSGDVPLADPKPGDPTQRTSILSDEKRLAPLLSCYPQYNLSVEKSKIHDELLLAAGGQAAPCHLSIPSNFSAEVAQANLTALLQKRGKKHSGVEGVLQVSIIPDLRMNMDQLMRKWSDGSGSTCPPFDTFARLSLASRSPVSSHARISEPVAAVHSKWGENTTTDFGPSTDNDPDQRVEAIRSQSQFGDNALDTDGEIAHINPSEGRRLPATPLKANDAPAAALYGTGTIDSPDLETERISLQRELSSKAFQSASPFVVSNVSAEERELALELLLLSPGHHKPQSLSGENEEMNAPENRDLDETRDSAQRSFLPDTSLAIQDHGDAVVTPSEQSPTMPPLQFAHGGANERAADPQPSRPNGIPSLCAACHGRMVIHRCGKREKPIDYEAIERAEKERKEREEAEKQQRRAEKRRAAEARRREARKKKKEEEDLKRLEEERLFELDAARKNSSRTSEGEAHGEENRSCNGITEWDQGASQSPSKSQASTAIASPSRTAATHAFRLHEPSSNSPTLYQNPAVLNQAESSYRLVNRGDSENHTDPSQHIHSSNNPYAVVPQTSGSQYVNDPPSAANIHGGNGHNYNRHEFQASQLYSSENGTLTATRTDHSIEMSRAAVYGTQFEANAGLHSEDTPFSGFGVSGDPHESIKPADDSQVTNSRSILSSYKDQSRAIGATRTLDVSKLEPSAPLSTADALEALAGLAGLANSLPAAPTNASHNFSAASSWPQHSYSLAGVGADVTHHPPTSPSQFTHSLPSHEYRRQSVSHVYLPYASTNGGQTAESGANFGRKDHPATN